MDEFTIIKIPECCASTSVLQEGTVLSLGMLRAALDGNALVPGTVFRDELTGKHVMTYRRKDGVLYLARVYEENGIWLIDEHEPWASELLVGN